MLKAFEFDELLLSSKVEVSYQPGGIHTLPAGIFTIRGLNPEKVHQLCHHLWASACPICGADTRPEFVKQIAGELSEARAARIPLPPQIMLEVPPLRATPLPPAPVVAKSSVGYGPCEACGVQLTDENSSVLFSTNARRHLGCPQQLVRDAPRTENKAPAKSNKTGANSAAKTPAQPKSQGSPEDAKFADLIGEEGEVKKQAAEDNRREIHEDFGLKPSAPTGGLSSSQKQAVDNAVDAVADMVRAAEAGTRPMITKGEVQETVRKFVGPQTKECSGDSATCKVSECGQCAERDCPSHDTFHYHHDGCPSCGGAYDELPTDPAEVRREVAKEIDDATISKVHLYVDEQTLEATEFGFGENEPVLPMTKDEGTHYVALTPRTFAYFRSGLLGMQAAQVRPNKRKAPDGMPANVITDAMISERRGKVAELEEWVTTKYGPEQVQRAIETYEPKNYQHADAFLPLPPKKAESAAQRSDRLKEYPPLGAVCKVCGNGVTAENGSRLRDNTWKHSWDCTLPIDDGKGGNPQLKAAVLAMNSPETVKQLENGEVAILHDQTEKEVVKIVKEILPTAEFSGPPPKAIAVVSSSVSPQAVAALSAHVAAAKTSPGSSFTQRLAAEVAEQLPKKEETRVAELAGVVLNADFWNAANFASIVISLVKSGAKSRAQVFAACEVLEQTTETLFAVHRNALAKIAGGWRDRLELVIERNCSELPKGAA